MTCLGTITGAHGLHGEVIIKSYTQVPEDIAGYNPLLSQDGTRRFELVSVRAGKKGLVARVAGIAGRSAAEALRGVQLFIEKDNLPLPEEGEWYYSDLIGLEAQLCDGTVLGAIVAVQDYGAGDLLEVRQASDGKTVMLPFTRDVVPEVDIKAGCVRVDPPPGLLDN